MSGISQDTFAEPMLEGDDYLQEYVQDIKALMQEGIIPGLDEKKTYKVYSIQGSSFGSHRSIVLTADDQRFFTVELGFKITIEGEKRIYPVTRQLQLTDKEKLTYHGLIEGTAGELISKAIAVMKNFGNYFKLCNNCQNYCNYYLDEIGLGETKVLTDGQKAALVGIAGVILAALMKIIRALTA